MAIIELAIEIQAPIERVFDLSRFIELHVETTSRTGERPIAGVITGLIGPEQQVTWQARHFGIRQELTSRITAFDRPHHFRDSMVRGAFRRLDHDHFFEQRGETTIMRDRFDFESSLGLLGRIVDSQVLTSYLKTFLVERNQRIKNVAERDEWSHFLPNPT
jgi:ligand-binding SRPBCC domain-containing protein